MTEDERRAKFYAGKGHKQRKKDLKERKKSDEKIDKAIVKGAIQSKYYSPNEPMKKERLLEGFAPGKNKILHSDKKMQGAKDGGRMGLKMGSKGCGKANKGRGRAYGNNS